MTSNSSFPELPRLQSRNNHFEIGANSALIEGITAIIFDLILLVSVERMSQLLCSTYNLRLIHDKKKSLKLRSFSVLCLSQGPIGHSWLSRLLSIIIAICTVCFIMIGFSVNGRSENEFYASNYQTIIHIPHPPKPMEFDYVGEYKTEENQLDKRPKFVSKRLLALTQLNLCLICDYSHCKYIALGFPGETYDKTIVNAAEELKNMNAECLAKEQFKQDLVNVEYKREKWFSKGCKIFDIKASFSGDNPIAEAKFNDKQCDVNIEMMKCFKRKGHSTHCAGVGQLPKYRNSTRKHLVVIKDMDNPTEEETHINTFTFSTDYTFSKLEVEKYLDNVAFMASLDLDQPWKLNLIAFARLTYNASVPKRNASAIDVNVTDIDKSIVIPCLSISGLVFIVLSIVAVIFKYQFVYRKGRKSFNTFSTVPEILQVLIPTGSYVPDRDNSNSNHHYIGLSQTTPNLKVYSKDELQSYSPPQWTEDQIL